MANNNKLHFPDGQEIAIYNAGNSSQGSIRVNNGSLTMSGGGGGNVAISSGANLIFQGSTATIGGTSSILSLGNSGDTIALNNPGVTYQVGIFTGNATFANDVTVSGAANVTGSTTLNALTTTGITLNGDLTVSANVNNQIIFNYIAAHKGFLKSGNVEFSHMGADDLVLNGLNELRFGSTSSATDWDWNKWAGIKYSPTVTTLTIGGPAASVFSASTSPPRITFAIAGTDAITMDGKVTINPVNAASIGLATMANGHLLLGTTTSGMAFDTNEIAVIGNQFYIETLDSNPINISPNAVTRLQVSTSGAAVTGTLSSTGNTTLVNYFYLHNTNEFNGSGDMFINFRKGSDGVTANAGNTNINVNAGVVRIGTTSGTDKLTVSGTTSLSGRTGINTTPHTTYALQIAGDTLLTSGWLRTTGSAGWYSQSYGGGWYMIDSTWIRSYGSKPVYVDSTTRLNDLQVGTGTTSTPASDLTVSGTSFNYRNIIWSDGNHTAIRKTSGSHSLDVYTNVANEGINLQSSSNSNTVGYSLQNSDNSYAWYLSKVQYGTDAVYSDFVIYGGNNASLAGFATSGEIFRLYHSKGMKLQGNAIIAGTSALNHDPSITLALGDSDTGFNWTADGTFDIKANTTSVATIASSLVTITTPLYNSGSDFSVAATSGRGFRFWNSDSYKIYMSSATDSTWGKTISWIPTTANSTGADYFIYNRIEGNNRGWGFRNDSQGGMNAAITGDGEFHSKKGFRTNNFAMEYNSTEDSIDFVYYG